MDDWGPPGAPLALFASDGVVVVEAALAAEVVVAAAAVAAMAVVLLVVVAAVDHAEVAHVLSLSGCKLINSWTTRGPPGAPLAVCG